MLDIVGLNYDEMLMQLASGDGMLPKSIENIQPSITIATKAMQKRNLAIMQAISEVGFENAQSSNPNDMAAMIVNENEKTQKKRSCRLTGGALPNNGNIFKGCISAMPVSMSLQNQWTTRQNQHMQMQLMRSFNSAQQQWQQQQQQRQQDYMAQQMQYSQINQPPSAHGGITGLPIPQWPCTNGIYQLNPRTGQEVSIQDNTMYSNSSVMGTAYENFNQTMPCRSCYDNSNCQLKSQVTMIKIPKKTVDVTTSTTAQQSLTCNSSCVSINESSLKETSSELVMQEYRRRRGGSQTNANPSRAELLQQLEELKKRLQDKDSGKTFKYKNNARSRGFWESSSSVFTPKACLKSASAVTSHPRTYKPYIYPSDSPFCSEKVKSQMIVNYTPVRGTKSQPETRHNAKTHATFSDSKMHKKLHRHQNQQQHQQKTNSSHSQQRVVSKHKSLHHKSKKKTSKASKTKTTKNYQEGLANLTHKLKDSKGEEVNASSSRQKSKSKESIVWSFNDASQKVKTTNGKTNKSKKSSKHKKNSIIHFVDPKKSLQIQYTKNPDTMIFNHVSNGASHNESENTMTINGKKPVNIYVHYR